MPYVGTCFRFYTQMRVQKNHKHLHIEFIVTSHNSVKHENIADWWKSSCRPLASEWYFVRVYSKQSGAAQHSFMTKKLRVMYYVSHFQHFNHKRFLIFHQTLHSLKIARITNLALHLQWRTICSVSSFELNGLCLGLW